MTLQPDNAELVFTRSMAREKLGDLKACHVQLTASAAGFPCHAMSTPLPALLEHGLVFSRRENSG